MAEQTNDTKQKPKGLFKGLISYQWILGNVGFFLFIAFLTVLYIANGHMADKTIRRINSTAKELKELEFEYKTVKSEMMNMSQESKLVKVAEPLGLKLGVEPPVRIPLEAKAKPE